MLAQVVQVAVGNACQPLEASLAMHRERPLTEFARGGAGEGAMQGIHLRQQADVLCRIAPHERHGRRMASVLDLPALRELGNATRHLRAG